MKCLDIFPGRPVRSDGNQQLHVLSHMVNRCREELLWLADLLRSPRTSVEFWIQAMLPPLRAFCITFESAKLYHETFSGPESAK